jgi:hypothetical protein
MTRVRATFHYAIRDLVVAREFLGATMNLAIDDHDIVITLPVDGDDSGAKAGPNLREYDERFPPRDTIEQAAGTKQIFVTMVDNSAESPLTSIDLLRVDAVIREATFAADDFEGYGAPKEVSERANAEVERAAKAADTAVERLLAWTRVSNGQTWLGLAGEQVHRVGSDEVVDLDAPGRLPWPARIDMSVNVVNPGTEWSAETVGDLCALAESGEDPTLADTLLADARFLAKAAEPRDPSRALLIAAIACEVKIKAVLTSLASDEQAPLTELLLSNPRDWSMAASALFHKPLRIIGGESLKDHDPELWKRIEKLFQRRNALAHRGVVPSDDEALDGVRAAADVFPWLDGLDQARMP